MKSTTSILICFLLSPFWVLGQDTYKITLSSLVIKGTSNVHKWESKVGQLNGTAELTADADQLKQLTQARFDIPVKSIKSSKGSIMDNKTYQALKSDACAHISFQLTASRLEANGTKMISTGTLTVACVAKTIELTSTVKGLSNGQFSLAGSIPMKMTDFGIKPPTALLGTMVTGDQITIEYEVNLIKDKSNY